MTIPELIKQGVTKITDPSWETGHLEIFFNKDRKWFMLIVENETGRKYIPERGDKQYYLKYNGYEEYVE